MVDDIPDFLKPFFGGNAGSWIQIGRLTGEDLLRKKNFDMQERRYASEARVLNDKLQVIIAQARAARSEFWDSLYKAYSLPSDLNYKIDEQGIIMKHVPAPPAENA